MFKDTLNNDCVSYITDILIPEKNKKKIQIMHEKKDRTTWDVSYHFLKIDYDDFIIHLTRALIIKKICLKQPRCFPFLRNDIHLFKHEIDELIPFKGFNPKNYSFHSHIFTCIFLELYSDFYNDDTYFCTYYNKMTFYEKKYNELLKKYIPIY